MYAWTNYDSPLGTLTLAGSEEALTGLWLPGQKYFAATLPSDALRRDALPVFRQAVSWLDAYFAGRPLPALPPLAPVGSDFRQAVWQLLLEIPYDETTTYGALARQLCQRGISAAPQAVGGAVGHNPISILIPCHRCVGGGREPDGLCRRRGEKKVPADAGGGGSFSSLCPEARDSPVTE